VACSAGAAEGICWDHGVPRNGKGVEGKAASPLVAQSGAEGHVVLGGLHAGGGTDSCGGTDFSGGRDFNGYADFNGDTGFNGGAGFNGDADSTGGADSNGDTDFTRAPPVAWHCGGAGTRLGPRGAGFGS